MGPKVAAAAMMSGNGLHLECEDQADEEEGDPA
jgi:hypothetical protein